MEILKGKVVTKTETAAPEPKQEIELFTAPVAVRRGKLSFGAIPVIQLVLSVVCGAVMWYMLNSGGELQSAAEEILRRIIGG